MIRFMKIEAKKTPPALWKDWIFGYSRYFYILKINSKCRVFMFQSVLEELASWQSAKYFYLSLFFMGRGLSAVIPVSA